MSSNVLYVITDAGIFLAPRKTTEKGYSTWKCFHTRIRHRGIQRIDRVEAVSVIVTSLEYHSAFLSF